MGSSPESLYRRTYFYVGGNYADDGTGTGQHIFKNQMYVEHLTPEGAVTHPYPLVLIHGNSQTGTNWLNTPDGRKGWASFFVDHGYEVYLIDQTDRGRSASFPIDGTHTTYSAELLQERFTACKNYNLWPQACLHTQWPGNGTMGDPIFDAYYASTVQFIKSTAVQEMTMQQAGAALLDKIGPAILIAHSQGGSFAWLWADVRPTLVKGIVALEPKGPPFREQIFSTTLTRPYGLTTTPLTYDPPVNHSSETPLQTVTFPPTAQNMTECTLQVDPPRRLHNLADIPVFFVTAESSYHVPYDHCTVEFLRQAGVKVQHLYLADIGIHGNGHMFFMEKNSLKIAEVSEKWLVGIQ